MFALAVVALVAAASCGGSDENGGDDVGGVDPDRDERDQPLASESTSVQPYVEDLLDEHSAAVDEILATPAVARDDNSPAVRRYVELYEPDSEVPDQVIQAWVQMADRGERARPYEDDQPMNVLRLDGEIEVVADDEVTFPVCDEQRLVVEDADGNVVDEMAYEPLGGEATAVHVDGRWYLRRVDLAPELDCGADGDGAGAGEGEPGEEGEGDEGVVLGPEGTRAPGGAGGTGGSDDGGDGADG